MDKISDTILRISPERAEIVVEQNCNGVVARKTISPHSLTNCLLVSRVDDEARPTGLLPDGCVAVTLMPKHRYYYIRYPELRADFTYFGTEYKNFPIPRLVFGFRYLTADCKVGECRVCVVKDERLTPDTPTYHYPFSNVSFNGDICMGNNALPVYKDPSRLHTLAAYILRLPNNNDRYDRGHNALHLEYRDLLEQMKAKDPSHYYTDILVPNGLTLKDFMNRR